MSGLLEIERWIRDTLRPERCTSAELTYDRMESQSGGYLPVIYKPLDAAKKGHWHDVAICGAFIEALKGAETVLDVGPGDGWPSLRIAHRFKKVVGCDPSGVRVDVQRKNAGRLGIHNVEFNKMDIVSLTFDDGTFDGVTAASVIEQSEDPDTALAEIFRVLKPGGRLVVVFEDYGQYFPDSPGDEGLWSEVGPDETVLFYQSRTKSPPREALYGLFVDSARLKSEPAVFDPIEQLRLDRTMHTALEEPGAAAPNLESLGLTFLRNVAPLVTGSKFYELKHMTSSSIDQALESTGFVEIKHLDSRIPECRAFFDAIHDTTPPETLAEQMVPLSELFGEIAVRNAGPGVGDFVIATKPSEATG